MSRPVSQDPIGRAEDDTAVRTQPSRHVDYLSHNWNEEDIWSSWKHIVSKRKAYGNIARLENALWRTWTKSKNKLKIVYPETLNWQVKWIPHSWQPFPSHLIIYRLKDSDVTWLYGPLQTGTDKSLHLPSSSLASSSQISKSNIFLNKKPILKKRSMSEIMLRRSFLSLSLLGAVAVQEFDNGGPARSKIGRGAPDYIMSFSSQRLRRENTSIFPSVSSSLTSPESGEKKAIHFNEQVEQCIALEMKGNENQEICAIDNHNDSDSDDGGIMMRSNSKRKSPPLYKKKTPRQTFSVGSNTIAMLPSTALKYSTDTPEPSEIAVEHSNGFWSGIKPSHPPFQETLRPSKHSTTMLFGDNEEDDDADMDWQPPSAFNNRKGSLSITQERLQNWQISGSTSSLARESSGLFMPYEEDEDDIVSERLFGKIVDTVNTARDIAQGIWNVGWRR